MSETKTELIPIYQTYRVCLILAYCGGLLEAYTYLLHGQVFCNAATGNFALMAIAFAKCRFKSGLFYLIPLAAYALGTVISEKFPSSVRKLGIHWHTVFILAEICVMVILGFLPESLPDPFFTVPVTFICAIQYNTFTKLQGAPLSTTFCTNNLRQASKNIYYTIERKDSKYLHTAFKYILAIIFFFTGVLTGALLILNLLGGKTILWTALLLTAVFAILLKNDLKLRESAKHIALKS
ncbi:MAG: DUF1275 domain-containing protein [Clostridiales bacterium]|nr:DUF1275 domain-containing protein [Clostridiales bacterium]